MSNLVLNSTRKVTAFSSGQNARRITIDSKAMTWGELQKDFDAAGIVYKGMSVVNRINKTNLVLPDAVLPEGDFLLYLLPEKTSSGAYSCTGWAYKDLRGFIQRAIIEGGDTAKNYFNFKKNYTMKSTEEMQELITNYGGKCSYTQQNPVVTEKKEKKKVDNSISAGTKAVEIKNNISDVVDSVAKSTVSNIQKRTAETQTPSSPVVGNKATIICNSKAEALELIKTGLLFFEKETMVQEEKQIHVAKELETIDEDALEAEAREMSSFLRNRK